MHSALNAISARAVALMLCTGAFGLHAQSAQHYLVTPLVSNLASTAPNHDVNLVNPWGLSRSSKSPWWVSDNGTGLSTLYDGTGVAQSLVVTVPAGDSSAPSGTPTGAIFNGDANAFQVAPGKAAAFLFATEDGTISGWNPGVNPVPVIMVNKHGSASYKGLTAAVATLNGKTQTLLYAADFKGGSVAVFDASFHRVNLPRVDDRDDHRDGENRDYRDRDDRDRGDRPFEDPRIPHGYAPFNVQNVGGNIFVAFARKGEGIDEQDGAGLGYVDAFSPTGELLFRLQHGYWFNAPWGITATPTDFGAYSHDILVGNFGSGKIAAFDPITGKFKGFLVNASNQPVVINGLWALAFGNDAAAGPATTLYFTAGIDDEQNGLFGSITAVENLQGNDN